MSTSTLNSSLECNGTCSTCKMTLLAQGQKGSVRNDSFEWDTHPHFRWEQYSVDCHPANILAGCSYYCTASSRNVPLTHWSPGIILFSLIRLTCQTSYLHQINNRKPDNTLELLVDYWNPSFDFFLFFANRFKHFTRQIRYSKLTMWNSKLEN